MPPGTLNPSDVALFLDVDGTLLDIRDHPDDVVADSDLIEILELCFARLGGAMSLISGRSIAEVDRIFGPAVFPVAGAHGAELRVDGGRVASVASQPLPDTAVKTLEAFAAKDDGLVLENKRGGASLHYRKVPALQDECRRAVTALLSDLGDAYRLIAGKMVFEIAPAAHHKGAAIRALLERSPFAGRMPVFVGDDVTDEDGFHAVNHLAGVSVRVGETGHTEALFCLPDVASVRQWLRTAILADQQNLKTGVKRS